MTPEPDSTTKPSAEETAVRRAAAEARILAAQKSREDAHWEAERAFWTAVSNELTDKNIRQVDLLPLLDLNRETVRRNIRKYTADGTA